MKSIPTLLLLLSIFPLAAQAGDAKPLSPVHDGHALDPQWSPDGKQLSYEVVDAKKKITDIYVLQVGGGEEKIKPQSGAGGLGGRFGGSSGQVNHEFAWGSRGGLWAFASSGSDEEFDLHIRGVSMGIGSDQKEGGPAFSADGRRLVFCSARTGEGDLYLLDILSLEQEPKRLTFNEEGLDFYARWSPVGGAIAYSAMGDSGTDLRVIGDVDDPQGSDRRLTKLPGDQIKPSWSPDGQRIAFYSNHDQRDRGTFDVFVIASRGGEPRRVVRGVLPGERRGPAWTPDGKALLVVQDDPNAGDPIVLVGVDSGVNRILDSGTVNNSELSVVRAPEGGSLKLAFVSQGARGSGEQGWRRVWVMDVRP